MLKIQEKPKRSKPAAIFRTEKQSKNLILMQAKAKRGFLDWVKIFKKPWVMDRINSGEMSQKTLQKHMADFEEWSNNENARAENSRLQKVIASQKAEISNSKNQLSERRQKVDSLKKQIKTLEKLLLESQTNAEDQALIDELKIENRDLKSQLISKETELENSNHVAQSSQNEVTRLNKRIENQRKQLSDFQSYITRVKSDDAGLKNQLASKDSAINSLKSELQKAKAELQKLNSLQDISILDVLTSMTDQASQTKGLSKQVHRLSKDVSKLRNELSVKKLEKIPESKPRAEPKQKTLAADNFLQQIQQEYSKNELEMLKGQKVIVYCNKHGTIERDLKMLDINVVIVIVRDDEKLRTVQSRSRSKQSFVFYDGLHSHTINNILNARYVSAYRIKDCNSAKYIVSKMIEILRNTNSIAGDE